MFIASFLVSSNHETLVKENCWCFGGSYRRISLGYAAPKASPTFFMSVRWRVTRASGSAQVVKKGGVLTSRSLVRSLRPACNMAIPVHSYWRSVVPTRLIRSWSVFFLSLCMGSKNGNMRMARRLLLLLTPPPRFFPVS